MKIEVEIISKEFIKPSSPTPQHLRRLHYSFLDQTQPDISLSFTHFYSSEHSNFLQTCNVLKNSLSEVLTTFYPVAGRVQNHLSYTDCNDQGVLFVVAKANCKISDVLEERNPNNNFYFTPFKPDEAGDLGGFSQITLFTCGGLAITFGMSHKLGDASSMFTFLNSWAATARSKQNDGDTKNSVANAPLGNASHFSSPKVEYTVDYGTMAATEKEKVVTKLFRFDRSSIAAVKQKCAAATRVEALTGFILGRFLATTEKKERWRCLVIQAVNLRGRMEPPLPEKSFGNFSSGAIIEAEVEGDDEFCCGIVEKMKEAAAITAEKFRKMDDEGEVFEFLRSMTEKFGEEEVVSFAFSSLHNFGEYESDFGWGKPLWVGITPILHKNQVFFMATNDGEGIEVQICLKEEDMAKFEIDDQLVAHAN